MNQSQLTVLTMYSKTASKHGKHAWVSKATSVTSVSYLPMQIFEHMHNQQFCTVHCTLQYFRVKKFTLLPSSSLLCALDTVPCCIVVGQYIGLSSTDYKCFMELCAWTQHIAAMLKLQKGQKMVGFMAEKKDDWNVGVYWLRIHAWALCCSTRMPQKQKNSYFRGEKKFLLCHVQLSR